MASRWPCASRWAFPRWPRTSARIPGLAVAVFDDSISLLGDLLCFVLAAPLALIALQLRGGALAATWWLLGASNLGWLLYDAAISRAGENFRWRAASEGFLCVACLAVLSAGLSHRRAVRQVGRLPRGQAVRASQ